MIRQVAERLYWKLFRRHTVRLKTKGFQSSFLSFAASDCRFAEYTAVSGRSKLYNTVLGRFSYTAGGAIMNAHIGAFCSIGPDVKIGGFGKHPTNWISTHPVFYSRKQQVAIAFASEEMLEEYAPVTIGNDVWIGANAMILDGVSVGDGAIIAAGAVVTKNVGPYEIVGGVSAKLIRKRFTDPEISMLMASKWWELDTAFLNKHQHLFRSNDVAALMNAVKTAEPR